MQIQFQFDVRTIALFVALTFFIQSMAIGAQAFLIRELKQYRGVEAALLANLCVALGLMLRLFASLLPAFLTTILSNILLLVDQNHDHRNRTERKGNHPVPKVVIPICKVRQENQDRCDHPNHKCPVVAQAGELAESDVKKSGTHQEQDIGQDGRQEIRQ